MFSGEFGVANRGTALFQSVITHYGTFILTGCKVPWALRGGAGSAASAEALTVICGLHCTYKPQIPVRTLNHSQPIMLMLFRPLAGRSPYHSPCLSTLNSADFIVGTRDARGGVRRLRQMRQFLHPRWYNRRNCRKCSGQLSVGIYSRKMRRPSWSAFLLYWME